MGIESTGLRAFEIRAGDLSDDGTLTLSVSSDVELERGFGVEQLIHDERSIRLSRFKAGSAPLLLDHENSVRNQVGAIKRVWIEGGKLRVEVRLSKRPDMQPIIEDIRAGIITNASIGYSIHDFEEKTRGKGERPLYRVTDWEPYEVSLVSVPADQSVGVGRGHQTKETSMPKEAVEEPKKSGTIEVIREAREMTPAEREKIVAECRDNETKRIKEIDALASKHNLPQEQRHKFIAEGKTPAEVREYILDVHLQAQGAREVPQGGGGSGVTIGMSQKEKRRYSLVEALRALSRKEALPGLYREASDEMAKQLRHEAAGFYIPGDMLRYSDEDMERAIAARHKRALVTYTGSAGGYTVGSELLTGSMVELLRTKQVWSQVGATYLTGLVGDVAIPKHTGGATAYWLSETGAVTASQQTFGQLAFTPHRLAAQTEFSKQLLAQSSISVEAMVRDDLMRVLAIEMDRAHVNGSGVSGEPLGLLNTTGLNTLTFGGAPTWADAVNFETLIEDDNADLGSMAYMTTPLVKGAWKTTEIASATARFIWDMGTVNGYPAFTSKQVPSNRVIFGVWSEAVIATWDGLDVVVDPYSTAGNNTIKITINMRTDFGVRNPVSFTASTDAGNQ